MNFELWESKIWSAVYFVVGHFLNFIPTELKTSSSCSLRFYLKDKQKRLTQYGSKQENALAVSLLNKIFNKLNKIRWSMMRYSRVNYNSTRVHSWATSQSTKKIIKTLRKKSTVWNTGNTNTQSATLFADTVSLQPSHKINVPRNRKAILQCITLSEWTSVQQPASLNLSLICLVLLWALRNNNNVLSLSSF